MNTSTLYISFWKICLSNVPTGRFVRHELSADVAGTMISEARSARSLVCAFTTLPASCNRCNRRYIDLEPDVP